MVVGVVDRFVQTWAMAASSHALELPQCFQPGSCITCSSIFSHHGHEFQSCSAGWTIQAGHYGNEEVVSRSTVLIYWRTRFCVPVSVLFCKAHGNLRYMVFDQIPILYPSLLAPQNAISAAYLQNETFFYLCFIIILRVLYRYRQRHASHIIKQTEFHVLGPHASRIYCHPRRRKSVG